MDTLKSSKIVRRFVKEIRSAINSSSKSLGQNFTTDFEKRLKANLRRKVEKRLKSEVSDLTRNRVLDSNFGIFSPELDNSFLSNFYSDTADWFPRVNDDGSLSYIAEKGDTLKTFQSQFGLSENESVKIMGGMKIKVGLEISGETIKKVTGKSILKLNLTSKAANEQRVFDQFLFAADHSKLTEKQGFIHTDRYFSNIFMGSHDPIFGVGGKMGTAYFNLGDEKIKVIYELRIDAGTSKYNSNRAHIISGYPSRSWQGSTKLGHNSRAMFFKNYGTIDPFRANGESQIISSSENAHKVYSRFGRFKKD